MKENRLTLMYLCDTSSLHFNCLAMTRPAIPLAVAYCLQSSW